MKRLCSSRHANKTSAANITFSHSLDGHIDFFQVEIIGNQFLEFDAFLPIQPMVARDVFVRNRLPAVRASQTFSEMQRE